MAEEFASANMPRQAGEGATHSGGDNPVRPQELEDMRVAVDDAKGKITEIPFKVPLTLHNCGSPCHKSMEREYDGLDVHPVPAPGAGDDGTSGDHIVYAQDMKNEKHEITDEISVQKEPEQQDPSLESGGKKSLAAVESNGRQANPAAGQNADELFLNNMRGWLMTVAVLFVNMSFDAILHPPDWMKISEFHIPKLNFHVLINKNKSPQAQRINFYLTGNILIFANALVMVLVLLRETSSAEKTLHLITFMVHGTAGCLAVTCVLGSSNDWFVTIWVLAGFVIYAFVTVWYLHFGPTIFRKTASRKSKSQAKVEALEEASRGKTHSAERNTEV